MAQALVKSMDPVERFLYTAEERHRIYLRRQDGQTKPWTDDPIFRAFYFTNVYRELDKTTVWYRENIRQPLDGRPEVLMATVIFRWFNFITTGELLKGQPGEFSLFTKWDPDYALKLLSAHRHLGQQIFTGAFMINSPAGEPKLEAIIQRIDKVWRRRDELLVWLHTAAEEQRTLQALHRRLTQFDGLGGFMAYELVCDLRFTHLLRHASDINTWANPGPGAIRGMYRVLGREIKNKSNATAPAKPKEWTETIIRLREKLAERMYFHFGDKAPAVEAREVEMWLCEYDKYVRLLFNEGRAKRTYKGA